MSKFSSIQVTPEMRRDLINLKYDFKQRSMEDVIKSLLKIRMIFFILERDGRENTVDGVRLYDKLNQGWSIKGYKLKE